MLIFSLNIRVFALRLKIEKNKIKIKKIDGILCLRT